MICTLCSQKDLRPWHTDREGKVYFHCPSCDLHFLDPRHYLHGEVEKGRYELHESGEGDDGYFRFVEPLIQTIAEENQPNSTALDFGCGQYPALAKHLSAMGYRVSLYDPYFWPDDQTLQRTYDFVLSCEVVEHFQRPQQDFARLFQGVRHRGHIMTHHFDDERDFEQWHYRRDPTHVSFYSDKTFAWIAKHWKFSDHRVVRAQARSVFSVYR